MHQSGVKDGGKVRKYLQTLTEKIKHGDTFELAYCRLLSKEQFELHVPESKGALRLQAPLFYEDIVFHEKPSIPVTDGTVFDLVDANRGWQPVFRFNHGNASCVLLKVEEKTRSVYSRKLLLQYSNRIAPNIYVFSRQQAVELLKHVFSRHEIPSPSFDLDIKEIAALTERVVIPAFAGVGKKVVVNFFPYRGDLVLPYRCEIGVLKHVPIAERVIRMLPQLPPPVWVNRSYDFLSGAVPLELPTIVELHDIFIPHQKRKHVVYLILVRKNKQREVESNGSQTHKRTARHRSP